MPRLIDTSRGAFEKFQEEQKLKREKNKEEAIKERSKIKKFFQDIKNLRKMDDDAFDEYIREQLEKIKKSKGEANDEIIRINGFIYQIITDLTKERNRKQKFNYVSPINFKNELINEIKEDYLNNEGNEGFENEIDDNNNVLITTTFPKNKKNKNKDN